MLREGLLLLTATAAHLAPPAGSDADLMRLLDRTVWTDIGPGRTFASLTPKQIAELRRCKEPTMAFQKRAGGWVQLFYPGIEMRTIYASAEIRKEGATRTILFYSADNRTPAEILHLAPANDSMVEQTRGFRPRTFLKCNLPEAAPRKR